MYSEICIIWCIPPVPSPPRSVRLEVVTFSTLRVLWLVPARLNGPLSDVNYAVDWFSIADNGTRTEGLQNVNSLPQTEHGYYWSTLENLQPNQTYTAKVTIATRHTPPRYP